MLPSILSKNNKKDLSIFYKNYRQEQLISIILVTTTAIRYKLRQILERTDITYRVDTFFPKQRFQTFRDLFTFRF